MSAARVLLVEDNLLVCEAVREILTEEGYEVTAADSAAAAEKAAAEKTFSLALLDMMLPDKNGKDLFAGWRKSCPEMPVVFMTAHGDIPTAVECLKLGAYDFLTKPVERPLLLKTVKNALEHMKMARKVETLSSLAKRESDYSEFGDIVAGSEAMMKTLDMVKLITKSDFSCLLIGGESGSGKGMLAKTIHKLGGRSGKPFVEINCSALPANLIESELFGHKKGAFTDAKEDKIGLFEMADGGTLFLDEIGDMDFNLQAKLLKVIEEQKFRRIGGVSDISVNAAIIAATNQDVEKLVKESKFRLDLYYRLNVIPLHIPPLRERTDDIRALAGHFLRFFSRKFVRNIKGIAPQVMDVLKAYPWPGNVRELRNVIERACILTQSDVIDNPEIVFPRAAFPSSPAPAPAPAAAPAAPPPRTAPPATPAMPEPAAAASGSLSDIPPMPLAKAEEMVIRAAMREAQGNKNKAATILGLHRTTLYKKLEEYKIE
jgi:DNA-binding NtrC family response regulator